MVYKRNKPGTRERFRKGLQTDQYSSKYVLRRRKKDPKNPLHTFSKIRQTVLEKMPEPNGEES